MRFLGIDFGWMGKPSGVAALRLDGEHLLLLKLDRVTGVAAVLDFVAQYATPNCVIGIDAPLVIPNETGSRPCDKAMHSHYGKYHAGAYPANRSLPHSRLPLELTAALEQAGFLHGVDVPARVAGRYMIEVHPHAAHVQLFALNRIVKYKRGTVCQRRIALEHYRRLLVATLPLLEPSLKLPDSEDLPNTGPALKSVEDQLDALLCAYIAAHYWYWGRARNTVHGNARDGYIVVPHHTETNQ